MVTNPQVLFIIVFVSVTVFVPFIIVIVFVITNPPQNPSAPPIYPCGICHKEVAETDQVKTNKQTNIAETDQVKQLLKTIC